MDVGIGGSKEGVLLLLLSDSNAAARKSSSWSSSSWPAGFLSQSTTRYQ